MRRRRYIERGNAVSQDCPFDPKAFNAHLSRQAEPA